MKLTIKDASPEDSADITRLIQVLAIHEEFPSPLTEPYVLDFIAHPGCGCLLAQRDDRIVGLLSYTILPNLFHAGDSCLIQELVIENNYRGQGIGRSLIGTMLERAKQLGCKQISISVMPENQTAISLYRSMGLDEEAIYLEKHLL